jgi:hypothetical protein
MARAGGACRMRVKGNPRPSPSASAPAGDLELYASDSIILLLPAPPARPYRVSFLIARSQIEAIFLVPAARQHRSS